MFFKIGYTEDKGNKNTVHISCGTAEVYEDTHEKAIATFKEKYPNLEIQSVELINEEGEEPEHIHDAVFIGQHIFGTRSLI